MVSRSNFLIRIRYLADTASVVPPWARKQWWIETMVPFIADAHNCSDRAVKEALEEGRPKMMESVDSAFEWLLSFLED